MSFSSGTPGKDVIGVDFGNTTTKLTISSRNNGHRPVPVTIPGYSRNVPHRDGVFTPVIPSVIHYAADGTVLIGMQVADKGLLDADSTVRWMAHYTSLGSPVRFRAERGLLSFQEAASDFLCSIIRRTGDLYHIRRSDLVVAVPAGSRDQFRSWLATLDAGEIISRVHIIEQPSAIAAACLPDSRSGDAFMIIDFGGSSLEISVVTLFFEDGECQSRILGRASGNFGGKTLDQLLLRQVIKRTGLPEPEHELLRNLLSSCEKAKENLSIDQVTEMILDGGDPIRVTRKDFEELLAREGISTRFSSTLQQALNNAASRGYDEHSLSAVILTGGSGAIPSIRRMVEARFGSLPLITDQPLSTISRGAAVWLRGSSPGGQVTHTYAIRVWNPEQGAFELQPIVRKGTPIPSGGPVTRVRIQATYDGQTRLGIPLYQLAAPGQERGSTGHRELRFGPAGPILHEEGDQAHGEPPGSVWINEKNLLFIPAEPPAMKGEPRFELVFSISASRELLISAQDLRTGKQVLENASAGIVH
jgi:molecular chaperone DnaK